MCVQLYKNILKTNIVFALYGFMLTIHKLALVHYRLHRTKERLQSFWVNLFECTSDNMLEVILLKKEMLFLNGIHMPVFSSVWNYVAYHAISFKKNIRFKKNPHYLFFISTENVSHRCKRGLNHHVNWKYRIANTADLINSVSHFTKTR